MKGKTSFKKLLDKTIWNTRPVIDLAPRAVPEKSRLEALSLDIEPDWQKMILIIFSQTTTTVSSLGPSSSFLSFKQQVQTPVVFTRNTPDSGR
jgi:hypothetical protein